MKTLNPKQIAEDLLVELAISLQENSTNEFMKTFTFTSDEFIIAESFIKRTIFNLPQRTN